MEYRHLGGSSVEVSQIGLGTWGMSGAFWGAADDAESLRVIYRALEARGHPDRHGGGIWQGSCRGGSRQGAGGSAESGGDRNQGDGELPRSSGTPGGIGRVASSTADRLRRGVFHPLAESGFSDRADDGGARAVARRRSDPGDRCLQLRPEEMDRAREYGTIDVLQPPYNMLWREIEAATLPYCRKHNIGVMPYSWSGSGASDRHAVARHRVRGGR